MVESESNETGLPRFGLWSDDTLPDTHQDKIDGQKISWNFDLNGDAIEKKGRKKKVAKKKVAKKLVPINDDSALEKRLSDALAKIEELELENESLKKQIKDFVSGEVWTCQPTKSPEGDSEATPRFPEPTLSNATQPWDGETDEETENSSEATLELPTPPSHEEVVEAVVEEVVLEMCYEVVYLHNTVEEDSPVLEGGADEDFHVCQTCGYDGKTEQEIVCDDCGCREGLVGIGHEAKFGISANRIGDWVHYGDGTVHAFGGDAKPYGVKVWRKIFEACDFEFPKGGSSAVKKMWESFHEEEESESDEEDSESDEEKEDWIEIDFEGVEYWEDQATSRVFGDAEFGSDCKGVQYYDKRIHIGTWNSDCDYLDWTDDKWRIIHETRMD